MKVARLFGRLFAFVVLERIAGVVVYELSDPSAPRFIDYVNVRGYGVPAETPTGTPLLVVANEVSGTTRIFEISMTN